jgi:hypothetical protein
LFADGTPLPEGSVDELLDDLLVLVLDLLEDFFFWLVVLVCGLEDCFSPALPVGPAVVEVLLVLVVEEEEDEGEVELEPGVVLVLELLLLEGGAVLDELVVVVVGNKLVVVDELDSGAQDSDSDATTPVIGRFICEIGVPGGTLTLNVYVWPPTTVTVTVHASAEAAGSQATAMASSAPATARNAATSLWRRVKAARLL